MNGSLSGQVDHPHDYYGQILGGMYSRNLQNRVTKSISVFRHFDSMGTPVIPYIAAWRGNQKKIWYEFVGRRLPRMMDCSPAECARLFRNSIREQRIYSHQSPDRQITENILGPEDLADTRTDYRREIKRRGITEAVYKCLLNTGEIVWLKDQAVIETYREDDISLSLGNLTIVSKELEADEARKQMAAILCKNEERLRHQATHDDLTHLYNTRYLYQDLDRLTGISRQKGNVFSLIFMDIDDFKKVVDAHGHLNASQAIREIGASIQASIKTPAYGVAYGGDEFIMVLPGVDKAGAMDRAEHIRSLMRQTVYLTSRGLAVRLQASFGVATFPHDADNPTALIGLADQAMFGVKTSGKNAIRDIRDIIAIHSRTD